MKCEIIRDLIPLYGEKLCSAESAAEIEEHAKTCEVCRKLLESPPEREIPPKEEGNVKPFKKVKRRLKIRVFVIVFLALLLLSVLLPLGYLTYCQIFKPEGGLDFDGLLTLSGVRPVAEMIAEGRAEEYVASLSDIAMLANDGAVSVGIDFYKDSIARSYESVKKYSPSVGKIELSFFGSDAPSYSATVELIFHITEEREYCYLFYFSRHWDGKYLAASQNIFVPRDMADLYEEYPDAATAIADYINAVLDANGTRDLGLHSVENWFNNTVSQSESADAIGYNVSKWFALGEYEAVGKGVSDFFSAGYTANIAFSAYRYDKERQMAYYLATLTVSDGKSAEVVTVRIYLDEKGFHSPREEDFTGLEKIENKELANALMKIFG